jgi:hypothetical protein
VTQFGRIEGPPPGSRHRLLAGLRLGKHPVRMTHQRYRAEAARLREEAGQTRFPEIKGRLLTLAARFDQLAADVERFEQSWWGRAPGSQGGQGET